MKSKLLLSILLFGTLLQTKAQNVLQAMKPRPADYEYLSAPDSLGVRHQLLMPDIANNNKNSKVTGAIPRLPYPIIFIHGLNSNDLIWGNTTDTNLMYNFFQSQNLTYGGKFDFNLNFDGNNAIANKSFWPTPNADIAFYTSTAVAADYYFVNFDVGSDGAVYPGGILSTDVLSNQSAIAKQGIALKTVIQKVLSLTGRDKVILMGHSMGGLAAREYLQNSSNWQIDGQHHIAKLITTGTPHGGYTGTNIQLVTGIDGQSEAYRDLRKSYSWTGYDGVYLYGGTENSSIIKNILLSPFYNVDVNCNGIDKDNTNIIGLNKRQWRTEIDYSYIVGICTNCEGLQLNIGGDGDGIVRSENANLSNFTTQLPEPKNEFIYKASAITIKGLHSDLPQAISVNMQGLDEPNSYNLAYGVDFGKNYMGFITEQSVVGSTDWDDYKFTISNTSNVSITIDTPSTVNLKARIISSDYSQIGSIHSNNSNGNITFYQNNLPVGNYFLEIFADPVSNSNYNYAYAFSLSKTSTPVSPVVISQIYGGGGNQNATYTNDYIELFNSGKVAQNLSGWSVQCTSAPGPTTTWFPVNLPDFTLQPGQYYLIQGAGGAVGGALPTANVISTASLGQTAGKVILVNITTAETDANPTGSQIIDKVAYGASTVIEGTPSGALSNTTAAIRNLGGCTDTDNNASDFSVGAPSPRNSSSALNLCSSLSVSQNELELVTLYPNPTTSKVFFNNTISNFKEVAIYNDLGQKVATTSFTAAVQNQEIDMSKLSTGIYILKFSDGATIKSAKVIKQ